MTYNVVYVVSSFKRCGPINMLYSLISNLDSQQFKIHCVTFKDESQDSRIDDFVNLGVMVHKAAEGQGNNHYKKANAVCNEIMRLNPDIVHSHGPWADYFVSKLKRVPTVINIHNKLDEDYVPLYGRTVGYVTSLVDAYAMKRATVAVAVSDSVAGAVYKKYRIKSRVIINGVNTDFYRPASRSDRGAFRKAFGFADNEVVYLHVGNMIERKRPDFLIRAFDKWSEGGKRKARLVFLGDGPLMQECKHLAEDNKRIVFCGNVSNVVDYCKASDVMVSATVSDGMSMATLEGLACGMRMLASDIDVHREIKRRYNLSDHRFCISEMNIDDFIKGFDTTSVEDGGECPIDYEKLSSKRMAREYSSIYLELIDSNNE